MPQSFTCLHHHIIFSTKNRLPQITPDLKTRLYAYLGGIIANRECTLLAAGGIADHIHLLVAIQPQVALSNLLRDIKSNSSKWIHDTFPEHRAFAWQDGYSAFAVSFSNIEQVRKYLAIQEEHHQRRTFQEELIDFLRRHEIPYDDRYIWK